jgi:hypothetical protein
LAIQQLMIGEARHRHMRDQRLGRNAAGDQPRRRGVLHNAGASAAEQFRTPRDDDPILRWHDIEPFGGVLADYRHRRPAAGAGAVLGSQRDLDARQMCWQRATAGTALCRAPVAQFRLALLRFRVVPGDPLLNVLEPELELLVG